TPAKKPVTTTKTPEKKPVTTTKTPEKKPVTTVKTPNSFLQWCDPKAKLPQETRYTVEVLLQIAGTKNCTQANQRLIKLTTLNLWKSQISDIKPLSSLTNLTALNLWENQISDIKPLANLTNLTSLDLGGNQISDI
ncbi:MAG: leucine-rich repeat domain-containing protein, partial [Dolichospermum sp.]